MRAGLSALFLAAMPGLAVAQSAPTVQLQPGEALLEVRSEGQALVRPDTATFDIGVTSTGSTARAATDANARAITDVIRALRGAGIEQRQIRTRQLSVEPQFRQQDGYRVDQSQIVGYVARNSVVVTTRDIARSPEVVAAAFEAGANTVSGPGLTVSDETASTAAARADAIARARQQADAYADGLDMRILRVLRVSERGVASRPVDIVVTGSRLGGEAAAPSPAAPPPVEAGEIMQTIDLWIDFAIAPR